MIKNLQKISLYDLEKVWYDCYGESFNREYPGAFEKLSKLVEARMKIRETTRIAEVSKSSHYRNNGGGYKRKSKTG